MFACPTCRKSLQASDTRCSCGVEVVSLEGVSVRVPFPIATLTGWKNRWLGWRARLNLESAKINRTLGETTSALTQKRLQKLLRAHTEQEKWVTELLAPLDLRDANPIDEVVGGRLPLQLSLVSYETNLFRDWSWGAAENQATLDCIKALGLPSGGKVLVLGAGFCRLAYDIHQTFEPEQTVATDLNPFGLLIGKRLAAGKTVRLHEFPIAPCSLDQVCVLRELKAPKPAKPGFEVVLSDCLAPPFSDASFDAVITPWLVDVIREDFGVFAARVNALLKSGGSWIELGSLVFNRSNPALNYSKEEATQIVGDQGFEMVCVMEPDIAYLKSPDSRHSRIEKLWAFRALKKKSLPMPPSTRLLPEWFEKNDMPIPPWPELSNALITNTLYAGILQLIDGKNSLKDLAKHLTERYQLDAPRALEAVTHFLAAQIEQGQSQG